MQPWWVLKWESCPTLTKYSWVVQFISHGHPSSLKTSFEIELGPLDFDMVSEPPVGYWADLPPYYGPRAWLVHHTWGGILKWESCPTLTKYSGVVQFISHGHPSSLKMSFEIDLGLLDFNMRIAHSLINSFHSNYFQCGIIISNTPPQT